MTKRTLAALAALLAFMAVLVAVPLATSDTAEAHTKTVKRCSYDPFTNVQQCWNENVAHTHRVIPDNPPPDTSPTTTTAPPPKTCPPGQHSNGGAGKNCHSHSFTPPCGTGTWSPGHGHTPIQKPPCPTTPPTTTTTTEPPKCPAGQVGTPPNCQPEKCPAGQTGTPPNCQTPPPPPCSAGEHRHGNGGCDPDHEPPCGVGKWNPGHGHTLIDRPACTYADASHATGPITYCGTQSHTHKTRHFHYGGNGCHPVASAHPKDPPRYTGASACSDWADDVMEAINKNDGTGTYYPPPERPVACKSFDLLGTLKDRYKSYNEATLRGLLAAVETLEDTPDTLDEVTTAIASEIERRWDESPESTKRFITNVAVGVGCAALAAVAVKSTIATAGTAAPAWVAWATATTASAVCAAAITEAIIAATGSSDDSGTDNQDGTGDDSGTDNDGSDDEDPEPTPDPKPTAAEIKQKYDEINEAYRRYRNGEITAAEMQEAVQRFTRWRCEEMGHTAWCNR